MKEASILDGTLSCAFAKWMARNIPENKEPFLALLKTRGYRHLSVEDILVKHANHLINRLDEFMDKIYVTSSLYPLLRTTVLSHLVKMPPVGLEYFKLFQERFPIFVSQLLDVSEIGVEAQVWSKFLASFLKIMQDIQEEITKKRKSSAFTVSSSCCSLL